MKSNEGDYGRRLRRISIAMHSGSSAAYKRLFRRKPSYEDQQGDYGRRLRRISIAMHSGSSAAYMRLFKRKPSFDADRQRVKIKQRRRGEVPFDNDAVRRRVQITTPEKETPSNDAVRLRV